jgi:hypothetical protein
MQMKMKSMKMGSNDDGFDPQIEADFQKLDMDAQLILGNDQTTP